MGGRLACSVLSASSPVELPHPQATTKPFTAKVGVQLQLTQLALPHCLKKKTHARSCFSGLTDAKRIVLLSPCSGSGSCTGTDGRSPYTVAQHAHRTPRHPLLTQVVRESDTPVPCNAASKKLVGPRGLSWQHAWSSSVTAIFTFPDALLC